MFPIFPPGVLLWAIPEKSRGRHLSDLRPIKNISQISIQKWIVGCIPTLGEVPTFTGHAASETASQIPGIPNHRHGQWNLCDFAPRCVNPQVKSLCTAPSQSLVHRNQTQHKFSRGNEYIHQLVVLILWRSLTPWQGAPEGPANVPTTRSHHLRPVMK